MIDKLTLANGWILVRQDEDETTTASGLAIGESMLPWHVYGTVVNAAEVYIDNGHMVHTQVEEGQRVCYPRSYGREIKENGHKFCLLKSEELIGVDTPE